MLKENIISWKLTLRTSWHLMNNLSLCSETSQLIISKFSRRQLNKFIEQIIWMSWVQISIKCQSFRYKLVQMRIHLCWEIFKVILSESWFLFQVLSLLLLRQISEQELLFGNVIIVVMKKEQKSNLDYQEQSLQLCVTTHWNQDLIRRNVESIHMKWRLINVNS